MKEKKYVVNDNDCWKVCETIEHYCSVVSRKYQQLSLFADEKVNTHNDDIRVIELFAGVGGFRVGLERASVRFKTVWNSQWEPSTKRQDASIVYCNRFGSAGHSNEDISNVPVDEIEDGDLLVGGFPCQDYSVATTLHNSKGIEGKKGVLWWQIHRILRDKKNPPKYLLLENVDRLLGSPASQRGRDFAIILASLADLGYYAEWRIINAAEYGMPQRRKRTYIVAYHNSVPLAEQCRQNVEYPYEWVTKKCVIANAFPAKEKYGYKARRSEFEIEGNLIDVSEKFNKGAKPTQPSPFACAGFMMNRKVWSVDVEPVYDGPSITLGQLIVPDEYVPEEFFINDEDLRKWTYLKGSKSEKRMTKEGYEYNYTEGSMAFPDALNKPSRTIITGEGGAGPSRFKHVIMTPSGRYRRLIPLELERLNMFPDNHTKGVSDIRRAFLMGNALVTGIVESIGRVLNDVI